MADSDLPEIRTMLSLIDGVDRETVVIKEVEHVLASQHRVAVRQGCRVLARARRRVGDRMPAQDHRLPLGHLLADGRHGGFGVLGHTAQNTADGW